MDKLAKSRVSANSNENYKVPNDDHAQNRKDYCCFSHCCFLTSHLRGQVLLTDENFLFLYLIKHKTN